MTKKPLPADPADVQRLNGKPQIVPKAAAVPTGPPPSAQSSTAPVSTPSATPKPVVSMIRVDRRDLEPEAEPGARHRVARWRMTEGATVSNHPMGRVSEPRGGISATPHLGGLHAGRTHFGSNQSSMWCRCHLCEVSTTTVTYQDVCCTACYRLPPRGQRTCTIMKNCVWVKWARITLKFLWLGKDSSNAMMHAAVTKTRNDRDARNTFYDAAETVTQMIEFGYIPQTRNRSWFYPDIGEEELHEPISQYTRERYLREIFFMNQGKRQVEQFALEQRVKQFMTSRITTVSDEALWEEARRRESEALCELQAVSSFQAVDEQGSYTRVVRGMRYSPHRNSKKKNSP